MNDSLSLPDIFSTPFLLNNVGAPFVIGLAVGYFAKKMLRLTLFITGGVIVLLFIAEYNGFHLITDNELQQAANTATQLAKSSGDFLMHRLSTITSKGVSGTAGFFVGFKFG